MARVQKGAAQRCGKSLFSTKVSWMGRGSTGRMGVGRAGDTMVVTGASIMGGGRFSIGMSTSGTWSTTFLNWRWMYVSCASIAGGY